MTKEDYLMENLHNHDIDSTTWQIRQALIDMASNLDTGYINGTFARTAEIGYVESFIDELVNKIFEDFKTK